MRFNRDFDIYDLISICLIGAWGFILYIALSSLDTYPQKPPQFEGTLICMVANTPTVQLYSSDVHYNGDGSWTLKHDVSGKYTTYVKSDEESCVIVPGKEAPQLAPAKPQPKVPPTTAYITPAPYVET